MKRAAHLIIDTREQQLHATRDGFTCSFCGHWRPWSWLAGYSLPRRYCESCIVVMDMIWRRAA